MTEQIFLILILLFLFFTVSGLATTNILRLTSLGTQPVLAPHCLCDNCGAKITPLMQTPIVSYMVCRGRCLNCGMKLPLGQLVLELVLFLGMSLITASFCFTITGVNWAFIFYEVVRIAVILMQGRRKIDFVRQYIIAVLNMIPFYLMGFLLVYLYLVV